jgi:hypothetical protein
MMSQPKMDIGFGLDWIMKKIWMDGTVAENMTISLRCI